MSRRPGSGRDRLATAPPPRGLFFLRAGATALALALVTACPGEAPRQAPGAAEETPAAEPGLSASVQIMEPQEGAVVPGPDVRVTLAAGGIQIVPATVREPGTGHHHLFIDTDLTPADDTIPQGVTGIVHLGRAQTEFTIQGLAPGEHRVIAVIGDADHIPVRPLIVDTVRFRVQP
ncbi:MAG: DUF4399 domain-containing protein [Gemmatimonadetes bacterium]|nr:DUF4399 domain-containing protein [Gemmatimonadota bacterium]